MTKVATPIIEEKLEEADIDFGSNHVTICYDTKQWSLTATYTTVGDKLNEDCAMYLGDNKMNLTPDQLDLIKDFLKKKIGDKLQGEAYHKRMSMDCPYEDRGVSESDFIKL